MKRNTSFTFVNLRTVLIMDSILIVFIRIIIIIS